MRSICSLDGLSLVAHPKCAQCGVLAGSAHAFTALAGAYCAACLREGIRPVVHICACSLPDGECVRERRVERARAVLAHARTLPRKRAIAFVAGVYGITLRRARERLRAA